MNAGPLALAGSSAREPAPALRSAAALLDATFEVVARAPLLFIALPALAWLPLDALISVVGTACGGTLMEQALLELRLRNAGMLTLGTWLSVVALTAVQAVAEDRTVPYGDLLREGTRRFLRVAAVQLLVLLACTGGLLLLLVPGLWLMLRLSLAVPLAVFEGHGPADALRRSMALTAGQARPLAGRYLSLGLLTLAPMALLLMTPQGAGPAYQALAGMLGNIAISLLTVATGLMACDLRGGAAIAPVAAGATRPGATRRLRLAQGLALGLFTLTLGGRAVLLMDLHERVELALTVRDGAGARAALMRLRYWVGEGDPEIHLGLARAAVLLDERDEARRQAQVARALAPEDQAVLALLSELNRGAAAAPMPTAKRAVEQVADEAQAEEAAAPTEKVAPKKAAKADRKRGKGRGHRG